MSVPAEDSAPPPEPPPSEPTGRVRWRPGKRLLIAAAAVVIIVGAVAASPFWAPAVMHLLPSSAPETKTKPASEAKPQAAIPDPGFAALKAELDRNATAVQQLGQRVAALEAKSPPDLAPLQQRVAALESKVVPDLAPLQQQVAPLDKITADLAQKLAALAKAEQTRSSVDPRNTALGLVLLQIRDAVELGRPFDAEYQALVALSRDRPEIIAAAAPLAGPAQSGVASRAVLAERLRQLAPQIATAKPPPKATWKSQIVARLRSLVTIRRIDGDEQSPAEAAVGAAERAMASGDLGGAVDALSGLSEPGQAAAQPWLRMAWQRLAVETALRQVQAVLVAALGNVPLNGAPPGNTAPTAAGKGG